MITTQGTVFVLEHAATSAAAAGVPAHIINMLGRWESEAYQLYIRTPRETLASISPILAN